jgi:hypothetical protein
MGHRDPFISLLLTVYLPFCHQILGNRYSQLKINPILLLSPLFIPSKCNTNATIEGSCNMQRFLIFVADFARSLHFYAANADPS